MSIKEEWLLEVKDYIEAKDHLDDGTLDVEDFLDRAKKKNIKVSLRT